ncbi:adenylyl-sulfate kinase [Paenibacillus sp. NEAU-GSW1]|uniref:adenylyl-sulfate kinase n=1 Tax=Paenibacillus sp. NEAU-GSW1 TaxID=2682486 RepID=UPI0012E2FD34|nr:adenylyl-sulfate kinase [Paenibacillus sp. NEAU-GSW1]MUT64592.1 adenylyl-sulfate kinase [Paenibacillus sp. NEAU-GSW1]
MRPDTSNLSWHRSQISKEDRQRLNGHKSCVLWFTGLSGSGKSTLAAEIELRLHQQRIRSYILDGDHLRRGLSSGLGFSPGDRSENIRRIGEAAKLFVDAGTIALVAVISPFREERERLRSQFAAGEFIEIYVKCAIETCEQRDPKGLYRKARAGEIQQFTGISAPYEPPLRPDLIMESDKQTIEQSVSIIMAYLQNNGYIEEIRL